MGGWKENLAMDLVDVAARFRLFLETLFTGRLVVELRRENEELRKERDYFRGRCERLELETRLPRPVRVQQAAEEPRSRPAPIGRKSWKQVVKDHRIELEGQRIAAAAEREAKKAAEGRPT